MSQRVIKVGTRRSALAQVQTRLVISQLRELFPECRFVTVFLPTAADRDRQSGFHEFGITGVFTGEPEQFLIQGKVDVVVHSLKDLPTKLGSGLILASVPQRADPRDALCGATLAQLASGSKIGTGSLRRRAQLLALRPDLQIVPLRGNVPPRLRATRDARSLDAVMLAAAGLQRLGLEREIAEVLSPTIFPFAVAQGAIGLEARQSDEPILSMLKAIECVRSRSEVDAERSLLHALGAGCSLPVGVNCEWVGERLHLYGQITSLDGTQKIEANASDIASNAIGLGIQVANDLTKLGGAKLLDDAYRLHCAHSKL